MAGRPVGVLTVTLADLERFQSALRERDMTCAELAAAVGWSPGHIRKLHCGANSRVSKRLGDAIENHLSLHGLFEQDQTAGLAS